MFKVTTWSYPWHHPNNYICNDLTAITIVIRILQLNLNYLPYLCDDSGLLCQVQYVSCRCPESRPGYPELMSLTHFRSEYLSGVWTPTGLGVGKSLSALTYFWQLFTSHTVQCGPMTVIFYKVGCQVDTVISLQGGIINGFFLVLKGLIN